MLHFLLASSGRAEQRPLCSWSIFSALFLLNSRPKGRREGSAFTHIFTDEISTPGVLTFSSSLSYSSLSEKKKEIVSHHTRSSFFWSYVEYSSPLFKSRSKKKSRPSILIMKQTRWQIRLICFVYFLFWIAGLCGVVHPCFCLYGNLNGTTMQALQDGTELADMTASYHAAGILRLRVATIAGKTFCLFFWKLHC